MAAACACLGPGSAELFGYWFYWPMLGTGLGVLVTGVVLGGVGGLFGKDWERRQVEKYLSEEGDQGRGPDARS